MARSRRLSGRWVLAHLFVVAALTVGFALLILSTPPNTGANIGAGLVAMPLLIPLGLPWSLPFFVNPYDFDDWSPASRAVVMFGPAYLNVALHALWWRRGRSLVRRAQS